MLHVYIFRRTPVVGVRIVEVVSTLVYGSAGWLAAMLVF
jgi:hypothetical protein